MTRYKYTLTIEFESSLSAAEERLNFTQHDVPTTDHVEELLMHRRVKLLKEQVAYAEDSANVEGGEHLQGGTAQDLSLQATSIQSI